MSKKVATEAIPIVALAVVLVMVLFCVQVHSIEFWKLVVGEEHAVLWSITVEVIVIASWIMSNVENNGHEVKIKLLAIIATIVTICAPILNTVVPIVDDVSNKINMMDSYDQRVEIQRNNVEIMESGVYDYRDRSSSRSGWLGKINEAEQKYEMELLKLDELLSSKPSKMDLFKETVMTIMISISIFIFQIGAVVLSNVLGIKLNRLFKSSASMDQGVSKESLQRTESKPEVCWERSSGEVLSADEAITRVAADAMAEPESLRLVGHEDACISENEKFLSRLCVFVTQYIADQKKKQRDIALLLGVSARDLSLLVTHNEKKSQGEDFRKISKSKAMAIARKLGFE
jgi:predicted XRE-type DNA-binding protein